jgi:putative hydrolase of the HAD superfamily
MKTPKMILFDYGYTLLYEQNFDFLRGECALVPYIVKNRNRMSPEQVNELANRLYAQIISARKFGVEIHERQFQRMLYEYAGIEFSIGSEEVELIKWTAASPGALMPDADKILDDINRRGIRSGVISNIGWSEYALKSRIDRLLPNNRVEFVIASSEYGFRKPNPYLFELALRKAGLPPGDVWFYGDNPRADVEGAARVGIFPVWYDNDTDREHKDSVLEPHPACDHLYIREWDELIRTLEELVQHET